jgi:hypothetical protein
MLDYWLEVSLHPEGPATDQLDQGFPWFTLVPEQMLNWYPNSTLHCNLPMQPSQWAKYSNFDSIRQYFDSNASLNYL